jgi:hypothetical protein
MNIRKLIEALLIKLFAKELLKKIDELEEKLKEIEEYIVKNQQN